LTSHGRTNHLVITGGEPLLQRAALGKLLYKISPYAKLPAPVEPYYSITIETNGTFKTPGVPWMDLDEIITYVIDYKLPSSGMNDKMMSEKKLEEEFGYDGDLHKHVKFVFDGEEDLEAIPELFRDLKTARWSQMHPEYPFTQLCFSPTERLAKEYTAQQLIEMIESHGFDIFIYNVQLHKLLGLK
jgi:organic radical activating enzyme